MKDHNIFIRGRTINLNTKNPYQNKIIDLHFENSYVKKNKNSIKKMTESLYAIDQKNKSNIKKYKRIVLYIAKIPS